MATSGRNCDPQSNKAGSAADWDEIVDTNTLDDQEFARSLRIAMHIVRRFRRYRTALSRRQHIVVPRRACLDHHGPFETDEGVRDFTVIMPRDTLPGSKRKHLDPQIRSIGDELAIGDLVVTARAHLHLILAVKDFSHCPALDKHRLGETGNGDYRGLKPRQDAGHMFSGLFGHRTDDFALSARSLQACEN